MNARQKAARLERALDQHAAWENRTLADLHTAGYNFRTIESAYQYRAAQRTLARLKHDELIEAVTLFNANQARRTK